MNANVVELVNLEDGHDKRNPVLKQALSPILFILKAFGLYYEYDMKAREDRSWMKITLMIYGYGIFLMLLYSFIKSVAGRFFI